MIDEQEFARNYDSSDKQPVVYYEDESCDGTSIKVDVI